jgi:SAM-dependent methyltransferase
MKNIDEETVNDFGDEWSAFSQEDLSPQELQQQFDRYFRIFSWEALGDNPKGFDMGCGSGRWAKLVAPRVSELYCIDASEKALAVAKRNLKGLNNCKFHRSSFEEIPLEDNSMDFGYSLESCTTFLTHSPGYNLVPRSSNPALLSWHTSIMRLTTSQYGLEWYGAFRTYCGGSSASYPLG